MQIQLLSPSRAVGVNVLCSYSVQLVCVFHNRVSLGLLPAFQTARPPLQGPIRAATHPHPAHSLQRFLGKGGGKNTHTPTHSLTHTLTHTHTTHSHTLTRNAHSHKHTHTHHTHHTLYTHSHTHTQRSCALTCVSECVCHTHSVTLSV